MKNKKTLIFGVLIFALVCGIAGCVTRSDSKKEKAVVSIQAVRQYPDTEILVITKKWSPTIPIDDGGPKKTFVCAILRNDVAYEVEYNDGPEKGGWIDYVPAQNTRPKSWKPFMREDVGVRARVRLSPDARRDKAPLKYTIALDQRRR